MRIEILGNYRVGKEPWRLIEVRASGVQGTLDFDSFRLPIAGEPRGNWQAPWDERILAVDARLGEVHACFFLFVASNEPLQTAAGPVVLPPVSNRPVHLSFVHFEEP